jgi:hypothetical protein
MELPAFRYHPDPVKTGSIKPSDKQCVCCDQARGYIYTGHVYAIQDLHECLCPWCIADGSAHDKFNADFTNAASVGGYGDWDEVPMEVIEEVCFRTPSFTAWQQERWWTHCGDAAEFLGPVGRREAVDAGEGFLASVRADAGMKSDKDWYNYLKALDRDHGPTAYLFQCRHCGKLGGYSDCH